MLSGLIRSRRTQITISLGGTIVYHSHLVLSRWLISRGAPLVVRPYHCIDSLHAAS